MLLLLKRGHWDYILGYPCLGRFTKRQEIVVCQGVKGNASALRALFQQMDGSNFAVRAVALPSTMTVINEVDDYLSQQNFGTCCRTLNHPDGRYAYHVEEGGVSIDTLEPDRACFSPR